MICVCLLKASDSFYGFYEIYKLIVNVDFRLDLHLYLLCIARGRKFGKSFCNLEIFNH